MSLSVILMRVSGAFAHYLGTFLTIFLGKIARTVTKLSMQQQIPCGHRDFWVGLTEEQRLGCSNCSLLPLSALRVKLSASYFSFLR
jgi:hypothetical protein